MFQHIKNHAGILIILVLTVIAYLNSLHCDYQFDDIRVILEDGFIKNYANFTHIETWKTVNNRPFALFTFALNYKLHGINIVGYHLSNIAIHLCSVVLVYILTIKLFNLANVKISTIASLLPALVFAVNPIQSQAVTYVVQRMTSLSVLFYLGAFYAYLEMRTATGKNLRAKRPAFAFITGLCIVLSILSKQIGLSIFITIAASEAFIISQNGKRVPKIFAIFYSILIIAGLSYVVRSGSLPHQDLTISRYNYFITQLHVLPTYFKIMFTGTGQNIDHYVLPIASMSIQAIFGALLYIGAITLLFFKTNPIVKFASVFFIGSMLIESSVIPITDTIVEHRWYLPIIPVMLILSAIYNRYSEIVNKKYHYVALGLIAVSMTAVTINRNRVWESKAKLWLDSYEKNPQNPRALNNYAHALMLEDRYAETIPLLLRAMAINPSKTTPITNIAISYSYIHNWERADYYLKIAEQLVPTQSETAYARGVYLNEKGDYAHAAVQFNNAISADRLNYRAREDLIECLNKTRNETEGRKQQMALLELNPDYLKAERGEYR